MPLEIPKSPVQHLRHRVSGFSIPGRLPCLLAVVLGLFAHSEALAQPALTTLTVQELTRATVGGDLTVVPDGTHAVDLAADDGERTTVNLTVVDELPYGSSGVTVTAVPVDNTWTVDYPDDDADLNIDAYQRNLARGRATITVSATKDDDPDTPDDESETRTYTIAVTRARETGSALNDLSLSVGGDTLRPEFDGDTNILRFTANVDRLDASVIVTAVPKAGWAREFRDEGGAKLSDTYTLVEGEENDITVRANPTGAADPVSLRRDYTITVTRTTTPGAPQNLRATAADSSVRLSWTPVPARSNGGREILRYHYRGRVEEGADFADGEAGWVEIEASNRLTEGHVVTSLTADGPSLTNGTTYIFQVRARNKNGPGSASRTVEATPAGRLPAPMWTTTNSVVVGNRRVTLSWTHIDDASVTGYQYQQKVEGGTFGTTWTTIADSDLVESGTGGTTRSYTVTPLTNGTTYIFRVRGTNSTGGGIASEESSRATPEADRPGVPTNLTATAGDAQVALRWTPPSDNGGEPITGYDYRYRRQDESTYDDTDNPWTATGGTGTTVTVHGLMNGTTYYFQVRAVNDLGCNPLASPPVTDGCGQQSLEVSATPAGKPSASVNLAAASDQDRQVTLTWTISPSDADDHSGFQYRQKAGGGYGSWRDFPNSTASTETDDVGGLTNGTTYYFQVRAVNSSGGGLVSNEVEAVPSTTPGAPTLTATAGDEQVSLTWTPADSGGRRIVEYQCQWRIGAGAYDTAAASCGGNLTLGASATSLTLTDEDGITNGTTYTFRVRAVNARPTPTGNEGNADGDWSNEASARPTDGSEQSYTISATIDDGKSWAKAGVASQLRATVEVNPRYTAQSTPLWVNITGDHGYTGTNPQQVIFGPTDSRRDASFAVNPTYNASSPYITIALFTSETAAGTPSNALAVTSVEIRPADTPNPPMGLKATRGNGEVTLSWATVTDDRGDIVDYDYDYRQKRQPGSYGRWTDFAGRELQSTTVTSNTVTGLTDGGTYAFQVRAVATTGTGDARVRTPGAESGPSDEVTVSLSGTTGGLGAPRNLAAAPGNGQATLSWTAPASDGGAAISGYQYQLKAGTGAYGQWTTIPGGPSARSYIVPGLTNGTQYFFRVRAVNRDGTGPPSTEESATPSPTVDTTLRALSLTTVTLAPVAVTLTPAFTPATRTYTAAVGSTVTQVAVTATPNKAGATRTITPADANTTAAGHQVALVVGANPITVRVADGTNAGVYTITVTRAGSVPGAPTGLTATVGEGGEVTLSWTAPAGSGAVSGYEYQQKAGTGAYGAWTPIAGSGPSTTSYIVTGLTDGTAYAFRVRAVNSTGAGAASNEATATATTGRLVWAKSEQEVAAVIAAAMAAGSGDDMTLDAGEQVDILGSALFNAAEGVTISYAAVSSDSDVASAGIFDTITVRVMARAGGMADITITATATPPSGVTINPQTSPREASITFPVEVDIEALVLELVGPTDMNLVEGGSNHANGTAGRATVRVQANRPVTREVTVTLMADRAMGDATADDFEADPIVIEAGETRGSTVVIAVDDGTAEDREVLVLFGMAADNAGEVQGEVTLHLWDAAVPALPVIAQLLLAAFLLWASGRRYRLRR